MLQNAYFLAKIGADTAEIELDLVEMLPIGHRAIRRRRRRRPGRPARPGSRPRGGPASAAAGSRPVVPRQAVA